MWVFSTGLLRIRYCKSGNNANFGNIIPIIFIEGYNKLLRNELQINKIQRSWVIKYWSIVSSIIEKTCKTVKIFTLVSFRGATFGAVDDEFPSHVLILLDFESLDLSVWRTDVFGIFGSITTSATSSTISVFDYTSFSWFIFP